MTNMIVYVFFWRTEDACGYEWRPSAVSLARELVKQSEKGGFTVTFLGQIAVEGNGTYTIEEQIARLDEQDLI